MNHFSLIDSFELSRNEESILDNGYMMWVFNNFYKLEKELNSCYLHIESAYNDVKDIQVNEDLFKSVIGNLYEQVKALRIEAEECEKQTQDTFNNDKVKSILQDWNHTLNIKTGSNEDLGFDIVENILIIKLKTESLFDLQTFKSTETIEILGAKNNLLNDEITLLKNELKSFQTKSSKFENEVEELKNQNKQLTKEVNNFKSQIIQVSEDLSQQMDEYMDLSEKLASLTNLEETYQKSLERIVSTIETSEVDKQSVSELLDTVEKFIKDTNQGIQTSIDTQESNVKEVTRLFKLIQVVAPWLSQIFFRI